MRVTLRSRIYLAIFPLLLLFIGITAYIILDAERIKNQTTEYNRFTVNLNNGFDSISYSLNRLDTLLEFESKDSAEWVRPLVPEIINRLNTKLAANVRYIQRERILKLEEASLKYEKRLSALNNDAKGYLAGKMEVDSFRESVRNSIGATLELQNQWYAHSTDVIDLLKHRTRKMYNVVIFGMIIAVLLTLVASTLLWKRIVRPIEQLSVGMENFSSDSTPLQIEYAAKDEIGELAQTFQRMSQRLKALQTLNSQKLLRSTAALRSILKNTPDAFFIISTEGMTTYKNPIAKKLFKESSLKDGYPAAAQELFERAKSENKPIFSKDFKDAIRITTEKTDRWFLVQAFPISIPSENGDDDPAEVSDIAAIFQDVTIIKLSDSLRNDLIATVSHELKTPITSARMSLYLLLEQSIGPLNPDQIELVETARDDVNRQLSTIEHLLDISRLEASDESLQLSHFRISDLIYSSIESHAEIALADSIKLNFQPPKEPISLEADRSSLEIVLNNFIANAIKYGGAGKEVDIAVSHTSTHVKVSVSDKGTGIEASDINAIFNAYTRTKDTKRIKGTGLGLKISKDIVVKHSGTIGCDSVLNEGSTFYFELPTSQEA